MRNLFLGVLLLTLVSGCCTQIRKSKGPPPWPGWGYLLDWEDPFDQKIPPPLWAAEQDVNAQHSDQEPPIRITREGEPTRNGRWAVRFHIEDTDPDVHGAPRAELSSQPNSGDAEPPGAERWYGFSIYLPSSEWGVDREPEIVTQWHQDWSKQHVADLPPPLAILTRNGHWWVSRRDWGSTNNTIESDLGEYATDVWTDWVVHVRWSHPNSDDGLIEVFKGGSRVPAFTHWGKTSYDDVGNYMKIGLYKWMWKGNLTSDTKKRVIFHDEVRIRDYLGCYNAVAP